MEIRPRDDAERVGHKKHQERKNENRDGCERSEALPHAAAHLLEQAAVAEHLELLVKERRR